MIITCPNCQARYQVASQTIGNAGRKVQCANCQTNWKAKPEPVPDPDTMFDAEGEMALDAEFEREEKAASQSQVKNQSQVMSQATSENAPDGTDGTDVAHEAASGEGNAEADADLDKEKLARQKRNLARRQNILNRSLPKARFQRIVRMSLTIALMTILLSGYLFRENIVLSFPGMAGLYGAVGIKVNVVGLEFRNIRTLRSLRDGAEMMEITASITNISPDQVVVPPVLVSLLDKAGNSIYEWSTAPQVVGMQAGEWIDFKTQLTSPPPGAVSVRLSFVIN